MAQPNTAPPTPGPLITPRSAPNARTGTIAAHPARTPAITTTGMWETRATYATLVPIAVGVVIASGGEPSFHMIGFTACILSAALRALKSVMQVRPRSPLGGAMCMGEAGPCTFGSSAQRQQ